MAQSCRDGMDLPAGTLLRGRYRIISTLGHGGFGITYKAYDAQTRCNVAVKELFPHNDVLRTSDHHTVSTLQGREDSFNHMLRSFENEAQTLIQLQRQEGIVRLFHLFNENATAYYVMELLTGEDLGCRLKRCGPMRWDHLAPIMKTLLIALEQIHRVGLIHRDISPDNIFLTENSGARLIDFGSVRTYQGGDHFTAIIKHGFAPWEQYLTDGAQGPWTDIYSLSVTAYYALSGQLPPTAPQRRLRDTVVPLEHVCQDVPLAACRAIQKGMAVRIEDRFQNVQQIRAALFSECLGGRAEAENLHCRSGVFAGQGWHLRPGTTVRIGRSPECELVYPGSTPGISRHQCTIYYSPNGSMVVRDDNSTYGTFLLAGDRRMKLEPGKWYHAKGMWLCFGQQEEYIIK